MRVLITGGRTFQDATAIRRGLIHIIGRYYITQHDGIFIHGGAAGVDSMAGDILSRMGFHTARVRPLYITHPRSAPMKRNAAMLLLQPEVCVAFPGGAGTDNMVHQASVAGVTVIRMDEHGNPREELI